MTVRKVGDRWHTVGKGGKLGKRGFKSKAAAEKAQARGRALAKKNPLAKPAGSKPASTASGGSTTTKKKKGPGIGVKYTAGKDVVLIAAPASEEVMKKSMVQDRVGDGRILTQDTLKKIGAKVQTGDYAINLGVVAADTIIDKKTGQNAALTGGSVTAWAPEGFLLMHAFDIKGAGNKFDRNAARAMHEALVIAHNGYNPKTGVWVGFPRNADGSMSAGMIYRVLRHGGQLTRHFSNKTDLGKRMSRPVKNVLKMAGLRM